MICWLLHLSRSPDCFQIGWPMRLDHDFFCIGSPTNRKVRKEKASVANQEGNKKDANEDEEMGVRYTLDISNYTK